MPGPQLPLELQLHILDLAIPPPTFYSFKSRRIACKTFALVHRSWTARALKRLDEHVQLPLWDTKDATNLAAERLVQLSRERLSTTRFDIVDEYGAPHFNLDDTLESSKRKLPSMERLGLRQTYGACECCDFKALQKALSKKRKEDLPYCPFIEAIPKLPLTLRYLSIAHYDVGWSPTFSKLVHLETLLLTAVEQGVRWSQFFSPCQNSRLRILGVKFPFSEKLSGDQLALLAPSIKHLAIVGQPSHLTTLANSPILPPTLQTLTIVVPPWESCVPFATREACDASLRGACEAAGVELSISWCETEDDLSAFDLEEWAVSVGA